MTRIPLPEYAMRLAYTAAMRSEDPYRQVGAVALDEDNRVIGTAYNGTMQGYVASKDFWKDRPGRKKFMLHAEINLCSLFKRGEAAMVACTTKPCTSCMQALCAHGVRTIYYCEDYPESEADIIAKHYNIQLIQIPKPN